MKAKVNHLVKSAIDAHVNSKVMKRNTMKALVLAILFLTSCTEQTPVSHLHDILDYSVHEIVEKVLDHDPIIRGNIELYFVEDGNWYLYGIYPLVSVYIDYDDEWHDIVVFDDSYIIHFVENESRGNFQHYVVYDRKQLYF